MDRLGKYEIRQVLGRGAMGTVYEGWDPVIYRRVAIKTVRLPDSGDSEERELLGRFQQEAQAAGRLHHPNVVGVFDYAETDELAYIVMEFVDGHTLKAELEDGAPRGRDDVARLMGGLLAGLGYSHAQGVIHRDIKPANVILTADSQVKIADFGIARIESSTMTQAGTIMGTPAYMSPEQFEGVGVDSRTDIYSAGVLLYQLLTGKRPFEGSMATIMHAVMNGTLRLPSAITASVTPALDAVVARAMARVPADRFPTAAAFEAALRAALGAEPAAAAAEAWTATDEATVVRTAPLARPSAAGGTAGATADGRANAGKRAGRPDAVTPPRAGSNSRMLLVLAGVAAVLLAGGGAFWAMGGHGPAATPAGSTASVAASDPAAGQMAAATPAPPSVPPSMPPAAPPSAAPPSAASPISAAPPPQGPPKAVATSPRPVTLGSAPVTPAQSIASAGSPPGVAPPAATPLAATQPAATPPAATQPVASPPVVTPPVVTLPLVTPPLVTRPVVTLAPAPIVTATAPAPPAAQPRAEALPPPPPAPSVAFAAPSPDAVRRALATALRGTPCAATTGDEGPGGAPIIRGVLGRQAEHDLHGAIQDVVPDRAIDWQATPADGPYCAVLDAVRAYVRPFAGPRGVRLTLADNRMDLVAEELIRPRVTIPAFPAFLQLDYFASDGSIEHMHDATGAAYPAGAAPSFGDPKPGAKTWAVDIPFGTDLIVGIASSVPLFSAPRPAGDTADAYLRDLRAALDTAARGGARLSSSVIVVRTSPKR